MTTFLLILFPIPTWQRIAAAQRQWNVVLAAGFLPVLLLASIVEGYGLVCLPRPRGAMGHRDTLPLKEAILFELLAAVLWIVVVLVLGRLVKALGDTFHGRHSFRQAFTVSAYALGPMLLLRMLDVVPGLSPWLSWGIGMALTASLLYYGIPIIMQPDPPHAFGLYMISVLLTAMVTGLLRFVTGWYIQGRLGKLEALISRVAAHLPF